MEIINNKLTTHIDGYLDALSDIDGCRREFVSRAFLVHSKKSDLQAALSLFFEYIKEPTIIKEKNYLDNNYIEFFLKEMLLIKPFSGLYQPYESNKIPKDFEDSYRDYVVFHLSDYIDLIFESQDINFKEYSQMTIALLKNESGNFIVLTMKKKEIELYLCFFRKFITEKEFIQWFNNIVMSFEKKISNKSIPQSSNDVIYVAQASLAVNKKIGFLLNQAIKKGFLDRSSKSFLLNYLSEEIIDEFENTLPEFNQ